MSTREEQSVGYWLTPAGCVASGGHAPHPDGPCTTCTVCGAALSEGRAS